MQGHGTAKQPEHPGEEALDDGRTPFVGPPKPLGRATFDEAVYWAQSALHWRASKADRLANPAPGSQLWSEFSPAHCEALARRAERHVRDAARRAEMSLAYERRLREVAP